MATGPGPVAPVAVPAIDEGSSLLSDYEQAEAGGEPPTANGGELHCPSACRDVHCAPAPALWSAELLSSCLTALVLPVSMRVPAESAELGAAASKMQWRTPAMMLWRGCPSGAGGCLDALGLNAAVQSVFSGSCSCGPG